MTTDTAAGLALALYLLGVVASFGVRSWLHRRRTGTSGYLGLSGAPGSAQWWGGILFAVAIVLAAAGPALAVAGVGPQPAALPQALRWLGLVAAVLGFAAVLVAQSAMGRSWRIGVDEAERTALVTGGVFALVRNPIFTAMGVALAGLTLMVPSLVSGLALAAFIVAVELQVRAVEEPYLLTVHGQTYADYAARVGRFVPAVGRLRPHRLKELAA